MPARPPPEHQLVRTLPLDSSPEWGDCEVIGVSIIGIGVHFSAPSVADLVGRRISIEVRAATGASVSLGLNGERPSASYRFRPFRSRSRTPTLMSANRTVAACRPKWIPMALRDCPPS